MLTWLRMSQKEVLHSIRTAVRVKPNIKTQPFNIVNGASSKNL